MKYQFNAEEHVHMLDDLMLTGTSSVMKMLKPPLAYWASGHAVKEFGVTDPKLLTVIKNSKRKPPTPEQSIAIEALKTSVATSLQVIKTMEPDSFLESIIRAYNAHAVSFKESGEEGTDMHAELEKYVKWCLTEFQGKPQWNKTSHPAVESFSAWAEKNVEEFLWSELHTFSHVHFLGGISDCGARLKNGGIAIIDFKSSKEAYAPHFMQIGGYDIQLTEQGGYTATGEKVFELPKRTCPHCNEGDLECNHCGSSRKLTEKITHHIVVPFGAEKVVPAVSTKVEDHKSGFLNALALYRIINKIENK